MYVHHFYPNIFFDVLMLLQLVDEHVASVFSGANLELN